jgi:hypothetical protein
MIEEVYYATRELSGGEIKRRVRLRVLWDAQQWFEARRITAALDVPYLAPPRQANASGEASVH